MLRSILRYCYTVVSLSMLLPAASALGQEQPVSAAAPRQFAPGVMTTISPELDPAETYHVHKLVEITSNKQLQWQPKTLSPTQTLYSQSEVVEFHQEVWGLEISFKPLRIIQVDNRLVWYLVYRIRNNGDRLTPVEGELGKFSTKKGEAKPVPFVGSFVLEGQQIDQNRRKIYKAYLDRIVPEAIEPIRQREVPGRVLLDNIQLASKPIEVSTETEDNSVWGVAMWEQIDPEMDFFSIYVSGLTNAYRWVDPEGEYQPGDPAGKGRLLVSKTLQLNFWRPGDEYLPNEREFRFGVPKGRASQYGVKEGVVSRWTFR